MTSLRVPATSATLAGLPLERRRLYQRPLELDSETGIPKSVDLYLLPSGQDAERMVAIAITRTDLTAGELRSAAAKSRDAQAARRMLALALVMELVELLGETHGEARSVGLVEVVGTEVAVGLWLCALEHPVDGGEDGGGDGHDRLARATARGDAVEKGRAGS